MPKVRYIGRDNATLTKKEYVARRDEPSYSTVRCFDNGVVRVIVKWIGRVVNPQVSYPDLYKVYSMTVENYLSDGRRVPDPLFMDEGYPIEARAVEAYEQFLTRWTESGPNASGVFEEAGNTLELPESPPPPPPRPVTEDDDDDDAPAPAPITVPTPPPPPKHSDRPQASPDAPELGGVGSW